MFFSFFEIIAVKFSDLRMNSLITNRLYHVSKDSKHFRKDIEKLNQGHSEVLEKRPNGNIEIKVPYFLGWYYL